MKKTYYFLLLFLCSMTVFAQNGAMSPTTISSAAYMREIPALSSMDNIIAAAGQEEVAPPKRRGANTYVPGQGLPQGEDPLAQQQRSAPTTQGRAPTVAFVAHQGTVLNDPTGAIGPNHYVYAFNTGFGIKDRNGNVLLSEASLSTLFPGETLGDPVVVYDNFADRFIIMEFSDSPNGFLIAVCQGSDPVNDGWYTYRFNTGTFPDYEKLSIWHDGYYITANKDQGAPGSNDVVFAVERDKMLIGDTGAQMIGFPLPGASNAGFYSPGGFNATGTSLPPSNAGHPIVYMQDDSWSGVSQDHLKIWTTTVNWSTPANSSISTAQQVTTSNFDSVFDGGSFNNLNEPGSGPDIDALQSAMMYMTNYRRFGSHNSVVMNFVVDVSGNDTVAGIRWMELRQTSDGQPWTLYQEGTYTQPDGHSAFCGSINMDSQGNIGLGYTIVSGTVYTSLRYTGRLAGDALGSMTIAEQTIVNGDAQNNRSDGRYGDYAQLTMDPLDDLTFWHIGEYMQGGSSTVRKSHVAAFKIGTGTPDNEAPSAPTNLTASNTTSSSTDLSWTASTDNIGVTGYDVYQGSTVIGTVSGTSTSVTGLAQSSNYNFHVIAKDAAGNQSASSNTVNISTPAASGCVGGITAFPYSEGFENTIGAWTQSSADDIDWTVNSSGTPSSNTGPSSATEGTYYIYVEASGNGTGYPNKQAIINSPCYDLGAATTAAFDFNYHMYGATDMGTIDLEASNDNGVTWTSIWNQSGNQGNSWKAASLDLASFVGGSVQLRFNRVTGSTWQADIAIDNVSLTTTGGPDVQAPSIPTNLTASNTTQTSTDLSWTASSDNIGVTGYDVYQGASVIGTTASTSYNVTGLLASTGYSFTVVAKDAAGNESGASSSASVTTLDPPDTQAPTAPTSLVASNTTQTTTDLSWTASSDNIGVTGYDVYQGVSVIATTVSTSYNVTGLTASSTYSFSVVAKDAAGNESSASNSVSVTTDANSTTGCVGGISSYPYNQGFENTLGDWTQSSADDIDWTVDASGTPSSNTGPSSATEGTYYIYVEASGNGTGYPNKQAIINSPCYDLSAETSASFDFKYHMYGAADMGSIALEASDDNGASWASIWNQTGNQGNSWLTVSVDLASYLGGSVQLRFNRITGSTWQADIAIDDVSLTTSGGGGGGGNDCAAANLTLNITFDNYPEETGWTLKNSGGTTVASNNYSNSNPDGSSITETINSLASGDYIFTMTDSYGDGMCCSYGNGSYTLSSSVGTIVTGGSFTSSKTTNFCIDSTKAPTPIETYQLSDVNENDIQLYPNPAKNRLEITTLDINIDSLKIFNMYGALVKTITVSSTRATINVSELASGTYFIRFMSGKNVITKKFIKE